MCIALLLGFVCACVLVCVCAHTCPSVGVHKHVKARDGYRLSASITSLPSFFEIGSSLTLKLTHWLDSLASKPKGFSWSHLPSTGITDSFSVSGFLGV